MPLHSISAPPFFRPASPFPTRSQLNTPLETAPFLRSARLGYLLRTLPIEKHEEIRELCHWLLCCKNLWPESVLAPAPGAGATRYDERAKPFQLSCRYQSLRTDPECIRRAVHSIMGGTDRTLAKTIERWVGHSNGSDWLALQASRDPASLTDPSDAPGNWPRECLNLAMRTMRMDGADLSGADLDGMDLSNIDFRGANLFGCTLRATILQDCDMQHADLNYARMDGADLSGSKVEHTMFQYADMSDADLSGLTFSTDEDNLQGAILDGAILDDIGLDIGPYEVGADGAYALRKGLLPLPLDHLIREHLDVDFEPNDSDADGDYLAHHGDDYNSQEEIAEQSSQPNWQTTLCCSLLILPTLAMLAPISLLS
jgi:hypothetical protein